MNRVLAVALGAAVLTACDRPTSPTSASLESIAPTAALREGVTKTNYWIDEDYVAFSRCAGEDIHLVGRAHVVETRTVNGSVTTYGFFSGGTVLKGVGLTTGKEYIFSFSGKEIGTFDSEPPFASTTELHSQQTTVIKGEGRLTRLQSIATWTFDGTTFTEWQRKFVFICPGVTG